jgi:hypothetical protein
MLAPVGGSVHCPLLIVNKPLQLASRAIVGHNIIDSPYNENGVEKKQNAMLGSFRDPLWLVRCVFYGILCLAALSLLVACDRGGSVKVENNSSSAVAVFENGVAVGLVQPLESSDFTVLRFDGTMRYEVRRSCTQGVSCDQSPLASREFTWSDTQSEGRVLIVVD